MWATQLDISMISLAPGLLDEFLRFASVGIHDGISRNRSDDRGTLLPRPHNGPAQFEKG